MSLRVNVIELLENRVPKVGKTKFIAIDGHGGSGKSSLADYLAKKLDAQIIHTDDFASWENPIKWWPRLIGEVFTPIANGATSLSYDRTKWWATHHPKPVVNQPVSQVMILEGVSSLRAEFRDYLSLRIFVDTPIAICRERVINRDSKVGEPIEKINELWDQWLKDENSYFQKDRPKEFADLVIKGNIPFTEQIDGT